MCTALKSTSGSSANRPLKKSAEISVEQMLGHIVFEHQLALLAFRVEDNQCLTFGQRLAYAQYAGLQRRVVTVVGAVAGDEILDQAGEGVHFKSVVGNQHGHLGSIND